MSSLERSRSFPRPVVLNFQKPLLLDEAIRKTSGLSSWYGLGIFRRDKGTVEFNRKTQTPEKNRVSRMYTLVALF
jgi:hypothetical protein